MTFDPKVTFYLGILVTIATGVGLGTVTLTGAIPADWVPIAKTWCGLVAFIGNAVLTAMAGFSSNKTGPLTK